MKEENTEAKASEEILPDWSTSDKISGARYRLGCALLKLKSTKRWMVFSCALGVTALVGGLVLAKTAGIIPAAIVAGVGVVASATNAVVQMIRSHNAKSEIIYTCDELDLLDEIAEREKPDLFPEFEDESSKRKLTLFLKVVHELNFNYYGLKATDPDSLAACEAKYEAKYKEMIQEYVGAEDAELDEFLEEHLGQQSHETVVDVTADIFEDFPDNDSHKDLNERNK